MRIDWFRGAIEALTRRLRWIASQQRFKTSLLEVMVIRQGADDAPLLHDDERNAIGQRAVFIGASLMQSERLSAQVMSPRHP
jgi:hypothetical protein